MGCKSVRLDEIATLTPGYAFRSKDFGDYPDKVIKITDVQRGGRSSALTGVNLEPYDSRKLERCLVHKGDYYLAMTGSIGKIGRLADGAAYLNQRVLGVRPNSQIHGTFLWHVLNSVEFRNHLLTHIDSHSVQANISASSVGSFVFELPDPLTQGRIAQVLDMLDRKIEVNQRTNDYLTTLASAIYREFVSHASGSMGVLADLVDLRKDSTKAGKRPELPYLPIDAIPMKSIGISEFKPNHEAKSSLQLFQRDDIIVGAMRVYFHRVVLAPCEGITRNTCFVLRPKNQLLREYALLTCFQPEAIEYANARAKGSTMPYAVWEGSFEAYPVLIPDESELEMFSKRVSPIIDKLRDSFDENGRLAKLRDALLPKLMSGEIDVSKVEMPTQPNNHLA